MVLYVKVQLQYIAKIEKNQPTRTVKNSKHTIRTVEYSSYHSTRRFFALPAVE